MFRFLLISALLAPAALAQQPPAYDCTQTEAHRAFDFWLGEWQVSDADGKQYYGSNIIRSEEKGCVLSEHWTSARGSTGSSINYYHPGQGKWHQQWIDAGASIITISGGLQDGAMVLEGEIYYLAGQRTAPFRGSWTPQPDGRIRQFFEEQDAEGKWNVWFDGFYTRSK